MVVALSSFGWRGGAGDGPDEACHLAGDRRDDDDLGLSGRNQMAIALAHPELSFLGDVADRLQQRLQSGKELRLLYEAAQSMLTRVKKWSWLKAWAMTVARRGGLKKAVVALARRIAVIMHRIWIDGSEFRWSREGAAEI